MQALERVEGLVEQPRGPALDERRPEPRHAAQPLIDRQRHPRPVAVGLNLGADGHGSEHARERRVLDVLFPGAPPRRMVRDDAEVRARLKSWLPEYAPPAGAPVKPIPISAAVGRDDTRPLPLRAPRRR